MEAHKTIMMSNGKGILVDAEDYDSLSSFNWSLSRSGEKCYAHRRRQAGECFTTATVKMHRLLLGLVGIENKHIQVDHINGNGLDNRKNNLRPCNAAENQANTCGRNKNGFKGVSEEKNRAFNRWRARIRKDSKLVDLGNYPTKELAAAAYDGAAKALYGSFARGNFII